MQSALAAIGGEAMLRDLVDAFHDRIETAPKGCPLHRLHFRGHGPDHSWQAQFEFLSGFLGGRAHYRERAGQMTRTKSTAMRRFGRQTRCSGSTRST
ncbi:hypothetical protein [Rhodosalinus sp.]|uniref:globin domain-containing protein n=1 Tax=Rhodosalinus sp. TaxID=2047741 RepID=UPI00397CEB5A